MVSSDRSAFEAAIDQLEAALRECPDDLWDRSVWVVKKTDPWIWPKDGQAHGRTEESIQVFSTFWLVAYHCLFFLDFYLWDGTGEWATPPTFAGGPEEESIDEHGAARPPTVRYTREQLLGYATYGRERARRVLGEVSPSQLRLVMPKGHPRAGQSFRAVIRANLEHVREHGSQLAEFVASGGITTP